MDKIKASMIIEILGRPPEHIKESLNTIVVKLGSEKGITLLRKEYHDPVPTKDSKTLFSAFAEVDVEFDSIDYYFLTLFSYMPSHIEITNPEKLTLSNNEFNELGNHILQRIHNYDAIAKNLVAERGIILQHVEREAPELFKRLMASAEQQKPVSSEKPKTKKKSSSKKKSKKK